MKISCASKPLINGDWLNAGTKQTFTVYNPFNQQSLAELPEMGAVETMRAIEGAERTLPLWNGLSPDEKSKLLLQWSQLIMANVEDLAIILTSEQGKPLV